MEETFRASVSSSSVVQSRSKIPTQLSVLVRNLDQLRYALAEDAAELFADFQDIREYGEAVATAHTNGAQLFLATPRIQKPGEMGIFRALAKHGADGMLVRNFSGLQFFHAQRVPVTRHDWPTGSDIRTRGMFRRHHGY